jgi:hypothetical protein
MPTPEIVLERNAFKIQKEVTADFEVTIAFRNRNLAQIPTTEGEQTDFLKSWRKAN